MLILDTDHLTALDRASAPSGALLGHLEPRRFEVCTTIVSVAEQLSGLLTLIGTAKSDKARIERYERLSSRLDRMGDYTILPWTAEAQNLFNALRRQRIRIGTMDLRIACIVLANDATLLSRNVRDFQRVPGLRVEDWLE